MMIRVLLFTIAFTLSLFTLWQCNVLPGSPSGNCEVYFWYQELGEFVTRRGQCTVTGNILKVTDSKNGTFTLNSTTGEYFRQEVDIHESKKGTITATNWFWIFYESGSRPHTRVSFDYNLQN